MKTWTIRWGAIVIGALLAIAAPASAEVRDDEVTTGETRFASIRGDEAVAYASPARVREGRPSRRVPGWAFVEYRGELEEIDGRLYARTDQGWIAEDDLVRLVASEFAGVEAAEAPHWPFAWVSPRGRARTAVVRAGPSRRAAWVRQIARREVVPVLEERDGFVRIADDEWLPVTQVRVARIARPPRRLSSRARWIDVDLDQQVLIAYEGETPVFATLISSGKRRRGTPTGVYRVRYKIEAGRMRSRKESRGERWDIEDVPHVLKFRERFALHGVYWHDRFGQRYSHGCVNLSPRDAHRIYRFARAGRSSGTVVRIRNRHDPTPGWRAFDGKRISRE